LWWRSYHDEPHLDCGTWDTLEVYISIAVRLERHAVERHCEDPSPLCYAKSSIELSERFMQNILLHPDIRSQNVVVPIITVGPERPHHHQLVGCIRTPIHAAALYSKYEPLPYSRPLLEVNGLARRFRRYEPIRAGSYLCKAPGRNVRWN